MATTKSVRRSGGRPRSQSAAAIGRDPGGRISVSSSAPPVAPSRRRPSVGAHSARLRSGGIVGHPRGHDPEEVSVGQRHPCADVRPERSHGPLELDRRASGVEGAVGGLDLVRVCDLRLVLLGERRPLVERSHQELSAQALEPGGEGPVVVVGPDRLGFSETHGAGVEPLGDPHDRHAGLVVAGHDRPLDRGGAAPARQQRRVHVDHRIGGQQRLLDQHPVRAHAHHLGRHRRDLIEHRRLVELLGLDHVEAERARLYSHRRRGDLPAAALRPVRPRDHENRPVRAGREPLEHHGRELRGAEVDGAH